MSKPTAMLAELRGKRKVRPSGRCRIRVGMATCGISAGADRVMEEFENAVRDAGLKGVELIPTGCVGRCDLEPMAEVRRGTDPPTLYIHLTPEKARRIVQEHLVEGRVVDKYAE